MTNRSCKRIHVVHLAILFVGTMIASVTYAQPVNILLAIADDWSYRHAGANGDPAVRTPAFDRVAREGVRFTHAFVAAPSCTPSRSALLSGQAIWRVGRGALLYGTLPPDLPVYPRILEQAGYFIGATGKTWGPGVWDAAGRTDHPMGPTYNRRRAEPPHVQISSVDYAANFDDFLDDRPAGKPFCFWYGGSEPHREYESGIGLRAGQRLADARLFASLPDHPAVRGDVLDYYVEVEHFDAHLMRMLESLERRGELDRTLVIVTSDHGMPFPRCKSTLYDSGTHVPLAMRLPSVIRSGRVVDDLVSLTDLAPTMLEIAGADVPAAMTGRSLVSILRAPRSGVIDPQRRFVVTAFERHTWSRPNGAGYPMRAIRTRDYLYIRIFEPDRWPIGDPDFESEPHRRAVPWKHAGYGDIDNGPTRELLLDHKDDPAIAPYLKLAAGKRPAEELYRVSDDPDQINNLAADASLADVRRELAQQLQQYLSQTNDPRSRGESPWDSYPYYRGGKVWQPPGDEKSN